MSTLKGSRGEWEKLAKKKGKTRNLSVNEKERPHSRRKLTESSNVSWDQRGKMSQVKRTGCSTKREGDGCTPPHLTKGEAKARNLSKWSPVDTAERAWFGKEGKGGSCKHREGRGITEQTAENDAAIDSQAVGTKGEIPSKKNHLLAIAGRGLQVEGETTISGRKTQAKQRKRPEGRFRGKGPS